MHLEEVYTTNILVTAEVINTNLCVLIGNYANEDTAEGEEAEAGHLDEAKDRLRISNQTSKNLQERAGK